MEAPSRDSQLTAAIKVLSVIILSAVVLVGTLQFLDRIRAITTIVVGAVLLCYVIYPIVKRLNARLPLWASILIVYALFIGVVAIALTSVVPAVTENFKELITDAPQLLQSTERAIAAPGNALLARMPPELRGSLAAVPAQLQTVLGHYSAAAAPGMFGIVVSTVASVALFVVIPIVALYMLLDVDTIRRSALGLFPLERRGKVSKIVTEIDVVVGGFIRGQLLVAGIVGLLIFLMLEMLHVKYAPLIAIVAGILEIVPYVGAIVGAAPAIFIALSTNGWHSALFVLIGFVVINQLEGHLIAPFVVSESVGLSPLVIILALLTGGELFGIAGLIVAVPIAGIVKVLLDNLLPQREPVEHVPSLRFSTKPKRRNLLLRRPGVETNRGDLDR